MILNKDFNENAVERFLKVLKAAITIAKPFDSDYTPDASENIDEDEEDDQVQQEPATRTPTLRSPTKQETARIFASKTAADLSALGIPVPIDGKELRFNISRDSEAQVIFRGPVTQEAIDKLAKMLELQKDTFPTTEELSAKETSETESEDAQAKGTA